jgi:hypothetical protein
MMFLNENCMTNVKNAYLDLTAPAPTDITLNRLLILIINKKCKTDPWNLISDAGITSFFPADRITNVTTCEHDKRKHEIPRGKKRKCEHSHKPVKQDLPRFNLVDFLTIY